MNPVILPQVMVCTRGSRNNLLQEVQCPVIHCLPGLSSLMVEQFKASRAPGPHLLIRKVEKSNESQQQRFIVRQYITQSPETWGRHPAWLEFSIPKRLSPAASWMPAALRSKVFLYTLPALTNGGAKATTNYIKKAAVVTADSMMVYSSTLNPVFWGLILCAWVCCWVLLWLRLLGFCVQCVLVCFEQTFGREISNFL